MTNPVRIQAKKYPDRLHYEWETTLLEETAEYVIVRGDYGRELHHHTKNKVFACENVSIEFFPFHKWFTVSVNLKDGAIEGYYCNIAFPAVKSGDVVSFVDLDLDLVKDEQGWRVVDVDEFKEHSIRFGYTLEMMQQALNGLQDLQARIETGQFPFDGTLDRHIQRVLTEGTSCASRS